MSIVPLTVLASMILFVAFLANRKAKTAIALLLAAVVFLPVLLVVLSIVIPKTVSKAEAAGKTPSQDTGPLTPDPSPARGEGRKEEPADAKIVGPKLAATKPVDAKLVDRQLADTKPAWVGAEPFKEDDAYHWPFRLDPCASRSEAEEMLPAVLEGSIRQYAKSKLQVPSMYADRIKLPLDYVVSRMVGKDVWTETVTTSFGPWVRLHALAKFDRQTNEMIRQQAREAAMVRRLADVGAAGGSLLLVLAVAWGYLKLNLATAGRYRWPLRAAAAGAVLALAVVIGRLAAS